MRKAVIVCAGVLTLLLPSLVRAQATQGAQNPQSAQGGAWMPLGGKVFVSINGAYQGGEQTIERSSSFGLYDETAEIRSRQTVRGTALFDIGGGYRIGRQYGAGMSYTRFTDFRTGEASGSLPHPLFFDRPRAFSTSAPDLIHKEQALHLYGIYYVPFIEKLDFAFSFGPSFFIDVDQDFVTGATFTETFTDTVSVTGTTEERGSESAVGFNIGGEATYSITPNIGVGLLLRYTRATVDFNVGGVSHELKAGNAQIGGGIRLRF